MSRHEARSTGGTTSGSGWAGRGLLAFALFAAGARGGGMVPEMLAARDAGEPIAPLTRSYGPMSLDEAYQVQARLDEQLAARLGPRVGYKVAYASKAAQQQFGVGEPARGTFFALQRLPTGSVVKAERFHEILLETEVAFTIGRRIDRPVAEVAALRPLVATVHAAFDAGNFVFDAGGGPGPVAADMVASGTGAHFFVLGPAVDPAAVELSDQPMTVARDGQVIRASRSGEVLGSPWNSLLWLVNDVVRRGRVIEPGEVVLTGTAAPAVRAAGRAARGRYVGEVGGLGRVELGVE